MDEIRERYAEVIKRFGHHYEPRGLFSAPHLIVGNQSFALHYDDDDESYDDEHREWLGIMLCAALDNLVKEHTADRIEALEAQLVKSANRLNWCAGIIPNDKARDQAGIWADEARALIDTPAPEADPVQEAARVLLNTPMREMQSSAKMAAVKVQAKIEGKSRPGTVEKMWRAALRAIAEGESDG